MAKFGLSGNFSHPSLRHIIFCIRILNLYGLKKCLLLNNLVKKNHLVIETKICLFDTCLFQKHLHHDHVKS